MYEWWETEGNESINKNSKADREQTYNTISILKFLTVLV